MFVLKAIAKGYGKLLDVTNVIAACLIILLFVMICFQVFMRYLPTHPVLWTTDIAIFCLIILAFIGMAYLTRKGAHVAIDILVDSMPPRAAEIVGVIVCLIGAATTAYAAYVALDVTINQYSRGILFSITSFNMPKWILLTIIPFGFATTLIEFVIMIRKHLLRAIHPDAEKNMKLTG